jgi:DNA invertase Pin-like site-specific DNA recombinase
MSDILGNSEKAKEKGRKGGLAKRGKKHDLTKIRESLDPEAYKLIPEMLEKTVFELINSPIAKTRAFAAKTFMDYYKPKRSTSEIKFKGTIVFSANPKINPAIEEKDKKEEIEQ